jgi:hypothetical protein
MTGNGTCSYLFGSAGREGDHDIMSTANSPPHPIPYIPRPPRCLQTGILILATKQDQSNPCPGNLSENLHPYWGSLNVLRCANERNLLESVNISLLETLDY